LNTALADAAAARVDDVLPEQVELHELLGFPSHVVQDIERRRAGGRPAGARNKRLAEVSRLVRERFGDVLLQQVAIATMPIEHLVALGLKPLEAMQERRLSAATVLPYLEQKKPIAVDVTGRQVVHLSIEIGVEQGEQDQGVIEGLVVQLDGAQLDSAAKPLNSQAIAPAAQLIADQAAGAPRPASPPPPLPPSTAGGPPGGGFAPLASLHAPASVVPPDGAVFEPAENEAPAEPGTGGGE
jgi:hypothetical protein